MASSKNNSKKRKSNQLLGKKKNKPTANKQMKLVGSSQKKLDFCSPVQSEDIQEWRKRMGLGSNWKGEIVNEIMEVECFEKEEDDKVVKYRKCFCKRHKKQCKNNGTPVVTKAASGYSNPFSHAVSALLAITKTLSRIILI